MKHYTKSQRGQKKCRTTVNISVPILEWARKHDVNLSATLEIAICERMMKYPGA